MNGYPRFGWVDILRFQQVDDFEEIRHFRISGLLIESVELFRSQLLGNILEIKGFLALPKEKRKNLLALLVVQRTEIIFLWRFYFDMVDERQHPKLLVQGVGRWTFGFVFLKYALAHLSFLRFQRPAAG